MDNINNSIKENMQRLNETVIESDMKMKKVIETQKNICENLSDLLIFDSELNVIELISFSNRNLKDNIFKKNLFYVEIEKDLFFAIQQLLSGNKLKLTKNPIKEKISIIDIEKIPLPPKPPTEIEAINNSLFEITMGLSKTTIKMESLSQGAEVESKERDILKNQVKALSNAVLMLTMKLGGK